jgi:hypothetical protein
VGDDPASATGQVTWEFGVSRGDWSMRSVTETTLSVEPGAFRVRARLRAWLAGRQVFQRDWDERIARDRV